MKMIAAWYEQQGNAADVIKTGERKKPVVGDGEVLVQLHSSAVNPSDVKKRSGAQIETFESGFVIPHSDGAGVIEAVGNGVSSSRIGERVWIYQAQYGRHMGTAAQYVSVPSGTAPNLPDNVEFDIGACIGIPIMTAHRCVFINGEVSGQTMLVTGASGRVGYYAVQLAKLAGARVIATAGTDSRCEFARQSGADKVINYRSGNLIEKIIDFTDGDGVDHIVEVEFGINAKISAAVLKVGGRIATYSSSQAPEPVIPFYPMMFKNISVNMVLVYNMPDSAKQKAILDINQALSDGQLRHRIAETWSLEQTAQAHQSIEHGSKDGCVIIQIQ